MDAFYTGLLANFGILAICGLLVSSVAPIWKHHRTGWVRYQLIAGVVFGATTAALILFSAPFVGGTAFDSRAAPAILSGVIGGPWAAIITAIIGGAARAYIGGDWVIPGMISVVFYCLFGVAFTFILDRFFRRKVSLIHLAPLGAICTICALPIFFIEAPFSAAVHVIQAVFVTLLLTNTFSVLALGFTLMMSVRTAADREEFRVMQAAVKRAPNGVIITDASDDRKIVFANDAAITITGYSPQELIGRSADLFFGSDTQTDAQQYLRDAVASGREGSATLLSRRKNGEPFHNQISLAPVTSSSGQITHWIGVIADVSQEMHVQNVLKTVSGQIPTALIYLNLDCQVEFINDAGIRLLGLQGKDARRRPLFEVVSAPVLDVLSPFIVDAASGREARSECKLALSEDIEIDARMTSAPTASDNGEQVGVIITIEDITAFKRMEQALAQSERLQSIGTLTGGIAHDFNNLNTVVIGNLDLMQFASTDEEKSVFIDEAMKAARRGAKLTQSLLSFGRKAMLQPGRVDLRNHLTDLETFFSSSIKETTRVEFINEGPPLEVHVDQTNLESAILNLVVNSDHAIGDKPGEIQVEFGERVLDAPLKDGAFAGDFEIEALGRFAAITISDNGPGVPHASRDKIIEPFYTTKGRHSGTGLGLAMVHGFVRQSGGFLRISDNHPTGTTVALYLPLDDNQVKDASVGDRAMNQTQLQRIAG